MTKHTEQHFCGLIVIVLLVIAHLTGCVPQSDGPQPLADDGFVDVTGGRIAFRVIGERSGIPVLVIHGGPGSSSCIYPSTFMGVAAEHPVVMYDQLGTGYSDRMTNLEKYAVIPRFVKEVADLRVQLGLEEVHLVGHSWGGTIAMEYLLSKPDGVKSVTFMGPLLGTDRWLEDARMLVSELPAEMQQVVYDALEMGDFSSEDFAEANTEFLSRFGTRYMPDGGIEECNVKPPGDSGLYEYMWGPSEFLSTGTLQEYNSIDRLPELDLPVLFLGGEFDEARPATLREYQAAVPGSQVVIIPDAGHVVNVDQTILFNEAVLRFIRSVESN
jgi:proline iminopeptidase